MGRSAGGRSSSAPSSATTTGGASPATGLLAAAGLTAVLPMACAGERRATARSSPLRLTRPLLALGMLGAVAYQVENAWQSWAAIHLHNTLGASAAVAATGPAVFAACAATGRFAGHPLQQRFTPRSMLAAGSVLAAAGSALAALAGSVAAALVGIAVAGIGTSVCAPILIAAAGRTAPYAPGAASSTVITLSYLGFVLGPAAVGLLADGATLRIALVSVALAAAVLALASRTVPQPRTAAQAADAGNPAA